MNDIKKPYVKPPPILQTDTQMIEFDELSEGPLKYHAFERVSPAHPWQHLGSSTDPVGAEAILKTERAAPTTLVDRMRRGEKL